MAKVTSKAYLYHFTRVPPIPNADRYGAHHAAEIPYVFANLRRAHYSPEPVDLRLEEVMPSLPIRRRLGDRDGARTWEGPDAAREGSRWSVLVTTGRMG